mmetsp:Transcript_23378/g.26795  ORF Transcript_23378/g.26795 Transcript_23378/m.26795 type:complete len:172 (-) Transcript_23378:52-567(-)
MAYLDGAPAGTNWLEFRYTWDVKRTFLQSITTICYDNTGADALGNLPVGAHGFGVTFYCAHPLGCDNNTMFGGMLVSSDLSSNSPNTWAPPIADYSSLNIGSSMVGNSLGFQTRYSLSDSMLASAHIPAIGDSVDLTCFTKYDGNVYIYRLDMTINDLDSAFVKTNASVDP